ncbi:hypothetical protein NDU88_005852 [Pleurodeles waltl]|uniref:Uncharacterized protein n=1 Tax=Pleurodeles waltl TaxID=8319 RepID=A0AAV7MYR5_PLEWA|nr:hypothetical protein NDU88_005852 [Pleurodeles waltl]
MERGDTPAKRGPPPSGEERRGKGEEKPEETQHTWIPKGEKCKVSLVALIPLPAGPAADCRRGCALGAEPTLARPIRERLGSCTNLD